MKNVLIKVYAAFYPLPESLCPPELEQELCALMVVPQPDDLPVAFRQGDMARISFEGVYFPVDEALAIIERYFRQAVVLGRTGQKPEGPAGAGAGSGDAPAIDGKLDVLDMEAWTLTRYVWKENGLAAATRSLDHVLEYAGH